RETDDRRGTTLEGFRADNLRSKVHVDADRLQPGLCRHLPIQRGGVLEGNPELVYVPAGGDMRVRACIDVWIDAQRNLRAHAPRARRAIDAVKLARRLRVDVCQ